MSDKLFFIIAAVFFLMQVTPLRANEPQQSVSPFSSKAVWDPSDDVVGKIENKCASSTSSSRQINCIVSEMRTAGASDDAIKVVKLFNGESYLIEFREFGQVDLATVRAFLYNSPELSHQEILVNGTPTIVDPLKVIFSKTTGIDIRKDPLYPRLARKFPNADLSSLYDFQAIQELPKGRQRFIFSFNLLNGCRGCEIAGSAKIGFGFDAAGRFTGAKLLGLKAQ